MKKLLYIILAITTIFPLATSCVRKIAPGKFNGDKTSSYDSAAFDYVYIEAIKQKLLGNGGDALKLLEQCLKVNPQSDAVNFQIAQILMGAGDIKNGKTYALRAYELNPGNFWYTMMLAGTYYNEHNLDSAAIFYEKAVKASPEKEELSINLGNLYSENMKYDKALGVFQGLDAKYGINEKSTVSTVRVLMAQKKFDEAETTVKKLIEKYPDEIINEGLLAEIYNNKGENEKAMGVYIRLLDKDPNNADTQLSLASFLLKQKYYKELSSLLGKIIINQNVERDQKTSLFGTLLQNPDYISESGNELQLSSMVMEAVYKDDDLIILLRPEVMIARGQLKDAATRLTEILESRPENYYAWEKLLFVLLEQKDYKNLEEKAAICASKFNRSFVAKLLYASAANENAKYAIALEELRKAGILAGNDKDMQLQVLSMKSDVYYRMKDYQKAFGAFDEALKYNNSDLTILNNYAYYLAEQNTRLKEAEDMAKRVILKDKSNATFLDTYAWVLYKRGKTGEAARIMQSLLAGDNVRDAELYEHYGYILMKRKDCTNAIRNWNKALKIDPSKTNLVKEIENCQDSH